MKGILNKFSFCYLIYIGLNSSMYNIAECVNRISAEKKIWITIDKQLAERLQNSDSTFARSIRKNSSLSKYKNTFFFPAINGSLSILNKTKKPVIVQNKNEDLISVPILEKDVLKISKFGHRLGRRCGGFVSFDSPHDAQKEIIKYRKASIMQIPFPCSIDNGHVSNEIKTIINTYRIQNTVDVLVNNFHNRYYESEEGLKAPYWIKQKWISIAKGRDDIKVEFFDHAPSFRQKSVMLSIKGSSFSQNKDIIIIGAHLDSINSFGGYIKKDAQAPGADDNASGIAVLTEVLEVIIEKGLRPKKTIQLMAFAAEEVGKRGSTSIASNYREKGHNVMGMLNFDMVGYKDRRKDFFVYTDGTNKGQNLFLKKLMNLYMPDITVGESQCGYACSDHHSWHVENFPASYVSDTPFENPPPGYHSENDTFTSKEHICKFVKLALMYLSEHAKLSRSPINKMPYLSTNPTPKPNKISTNTANMEKMNVTGLLILINIQRNL